MFNVDIVVRNENDWFKVHENAKHGILTHNVWGPPHADNYPVTEKWRFNTIEDLGNLHVVKFEDVVEFVEVTPVGEAKRYMLQPITYDVQLERMAQALEWFYDHDRSDWNSLEEMVKEEADEIPARYFYVLGTEQHGCWDPKVYFSNDLQKIFKDYVDSDFQDHEVFDLLAGFDDKHQPIGRYGIKPSDFTLEALK